MAVLLLKVPLGVLRKNENVAEDMIDIINHIQKRYVPAVDGKVKPVLFGGDQLTRERAAHAQDAKAQSVDTMKQLKGVVPKAEDWHTLMCFFQVRRCMHAFMQINAC